MISLRRIAERAWRQCAALRGKEAMRAAASPAPGPACAPRVLLLTSALGSGHLRAAQAVEAALRERVPDSTVRMIDLWSLLDEDVAQAMRQAYLRLVQERPELYDRLYRLDQRTWRDILEGKAALPTDLAEGLKWLGADLADNAWLRGAGQRLDRVLFRSFLAVLTRWARGKSRNGILGRLASILIRLGWARLAWRLHARLRVFRPDVVVATQMYPAALLSFLKARRRLRVPALGALTDFGMHDFWHQPGIDLYCVAHESIAAAAAAGLSADRIVATGMPLMPGFRHPPDVRAARARLRLAADAPVVLVLGGGLGLGVDAMAARLLAGVARAQVLVFAGHNASAHEALAGLSGRYPGRLSVWGWTDEPEVFLRAADVVVGKPGGLTLAEALACGRPLLAMRSLRGQESFNTRFLEQYGVGRLLADDELAPAVESLLWNPGELARIQQRAWALGARDGAARIAQAALALAQPRSDAAPARQEDLARRLAQRCLRAVDALYHARHRLRPVGEVLYVGRARYRGPVMEFPDGTRLAPGDFIGTLHFNNARFLKIEAGSPERASLQFARLMLQSMGTLADRARLDPLLADLPAFQGISWFKPHGRRVGFITAPFPDGLRKRMITAYFRLLVWAFAPAARTRAAARPTPTVYWLTREQLLGHHGKADDQEENRT